MLKFNMQNKKKILPEIYNFLRPKQTDNLSRIGIKQDGGYIIEKSALDKVNHLIAFGMSDEFSFETNFLNYNKLNSLQIYDHTVNHKNYIFRILKVFRRLITFRRNVKQFNNEISKYYNFLKFVNNKNVNFFPLKITKHALKRREINLDIIFSKLDQSINNIGLKIDIEGDEYNIIDGINCNSEKINFLIIEFHKIDKNKEIFFNSVKKLLEIFDIIHLHGNNHELLLPDGFPKVIEISFVNKKNNLSYVNFPTSFPIEGLDYPNNPLLPDIKINFK